MATQKLDLSEDEVQELKVEVSRRILQSFLAARQLVAEGEEQYKGIRNQLDKLLKEADKLE